MISLERAKQLRGAGIEWRPSRGDAFVLPDRGMDDQVFMINDLPALIQLYNGEPVVAFQGSGEWALDYVFLTDVLWLPNESQLRELLAAKLGPDAPLRLDRTSSGYRCQFARGDQIAEAVAAEAEDTYAEALLQVMNAA